MTTNNITRLLDNRNIPYEVFLLPKEKLGAKETSDYLKIPINEIFKSIIIKREKSGKPIIALTPGDTEVNLKLLATAIRDKKVFLPTEAEAEKLTGLEAGGISPLALINRGFQVVIDSSAKNFYQINVSGGQRGLNLRLPVSSLIEITHAMIADITGKIR